MKYSLLLLALLTIVGCSKEAESAKNVGAFKVDKLFEHEGCTVYRFIDDRVVYYTNCNGSTQSNRSCGKNCVTTDSVSTYRGGTK